MKMTFVEAVKSGFKNYFVYKGRAGRSEFWFFFLFAYLTSGLLTSICTGLTSIAPIFALLGIPVFIIDLGITLPYIAVTVRRFHDIGRSGLELLFLLIPIGIMVISVIPLTIGAAALAATGIGTAAAAIVIMVFSVILSLSGIGITALSILYIIWLTGDSQPGENKWGPDPKEMATPETTTENTAETTTETQTM